MRADQDRSARPREISLASTFDLSEQPAEHEHLASEFVSQLVDVSQELADVIASANLELD